MKYCWLLAGLFGSWLATPKQLFFLKIPMNIFFWETKAAEKWMGNISLNNSVKQVPYLLLVRQTYSPTSKLVESMLATPLVCKWLDKQKEEKQIFFLGKLLILGSFCQTKLLIFLDRIDFNIHSSASAAEPLESERKSRKK